MSPRPGLVRVCVTGPESTGKTTLARRLAEWAGGSWVAEASRAYAERQGRELGEGDVEPIARAQIAAEDAAATDAAHRGSGLLVLDTDLLSTCVYAAHYYGGVPRMVSDAASARLADLYLLCDVDVPWIPDGVRDRPMDREAMFGLFDAELTRRGIVPVVIHGSWDDRWSIATAAVRALIAQSRN